MTTLKDIHKCNTVEDLEGLNIGPLIVDIGYRGGGLGFSRDTLARAFNIEAWMLPRKVGAFCNYLGGGLRGAIGASTWHPDMPTKAAKLLEALTEACVRAYQAAEDESGMNDDGPDGETNWEALGTRMSRLAGIQSAY